MAEIKVRPARESDAQGIAECFRTSYRGSYCYQDFYRPQAVKRLIYAEDTVIVVAVEEESGEVLGTAAVLEEKGALSDLTAEFGRLVVHPKARRHGVGHRLMEGRLRLVRDRLHVGVVEARTCNAFSCRIALGHGFSPAGLLPSSVAFEERENLAVLVQYFGEALRLRRNHPRIIPEAYPLAHLVMSNCGLDFDVIEDEESPSYPSGNDFELEELTSSEGYANLLRIERGRLKKRELFGPMRLHYGFFKLRARNSNYLLARREGRLAGALGYIIDREEGQVRVFEFISIEEESATYLFKQLLKRAGRAGMTYVEADVSAYAPRMQRTLLELGFLPVAYLPSLVFHKVERLDILKMARVFSPVASNSPDLPREVQRLSEVVLRGFASREIQPRILRAVDQVELFRGLSREQSRRLAACCRLADFQAGESVFAKGDPGQGVLLVLRGRIDVEVDGRQVGTVGKGESLGEISALRGFVHSASARARTPVTAGLLPRDQLRSLIRRRPDIGVILYRNLALGLGRKLQRADLALLGQA
ncbi:MAG TPA: GNAT family N-acetyltransferase [Acidobacteriota bacterium]|nr:GNAT family N-acetyltransferase [Acidobacteriota bacterium]